MNIKHLSAAILFLVLFALAANGQGILKHLNGRWLVDTQLTKKLWAEQKEFKYDIADSSKMTLTFSKGHSFRMDSTFASGNQSSYGGKYKVLKIDEKKKTMTLKLTPDTPDSPEEFEAVIAVETSMKLNKITFAPTKHGVSIVFVQKKDK